MEVDNPENGDTCKNIQKMETGKPMNIAGFILVDDDQPAIVQIRLFTYD